MPNLSFSITQDRVTFLYLGVGSTAGLSGVAEPDSVGLRPPYLQPTELPERDADTPDMH